MDIAPRDKSNYYRTGVLGLRALQDRGLSTVRFSPDAEARWKAFRGELTDADRVDLLLRDGAAVHPVAFSAAAVFALPDLAADEPFGRTWAGLSVSDAGAVLREVAQTNLGDKNTKPSPTLAEFAKVWGWEWSLLSVAHVVPASRVVVAGVGAIVALADHMFGRTDMDFADQVLLVTDRAGERQLFGLAAALCGGRSRPRHVGSADVTDIARRQKFDRATIVLASDDADPASREAANRLGRELGA